MSRLRGGTVLVMLANVRYRGLAVAEGVRISRAEGDDPIGPFIELDPPFPVGTALAVELVRDGQVEARTVRVRRVHEGLSPGVFIQFTDGAAAPSDLPTRPQAALTATPDAAAPTPASDGPSKPSPAPTPKPAIEVDERRARATEQVPIYNPEVEARDTAPTMRAVPPPEDAPAPRDTLETPVVSVVSMEAEPEDEPAEATAKGEGKSEDSRRGGKKRKRSKTVIGH